MEQDKLRAEFEAWYFDRHLVVNRWDGLIYDDADQQEAWRAWRASREAVVVELPEGYSAAFIERQPAHKREMFYLHNGVVYDCRAAIHAAGIRTK